MAYVSWTPVTKDQTPIDDSHINQLVDNANDIRARMTWAGTVRVASKVTQDSGITASQWLSVRNMADDLELYRNCSTNDYAEKAAECGTVNASQNTTVYSSRNSSVRYDSCPTN